MRGGSRRGSYFFVIDAFIASAILIFTIVLLNNLFVDSQQTTQEFNYANDYLNFLTSTEIRDYQEGNITQMILNGDITDTRRRLSEQILLFQNQSQLDLARAIVRASALILPADFATNISLSGANTTNLYNRSLADTENRSTHLSVRAIEYTLINGTDLYGPFTFTVEVWI